MSLLWKKVPRSYIQKKAHAIPESIGNKEFVLKNECDTCNKFFGDKLEDNFSKYLGLGRTLSQIFAKNGVPSYKTKDGNCRIDYTKKGIVIQLTEESICIEQRDNHILFHAVRDTYTPIAVYKALVKMALSLLPYDKMPYFADTVEWLKEDSNLISNHNMENYAYMLERYISGPKPLLLNASGFIRKSDSKKVPYYQFLLEFANYSYQIIVPCKAKDELSSTVDKFELVQIIGSDEISLRNSVCDNPTIKLLNMSSKAKTENECLDLCLYFEKYEELEGNGENITDILEKEGIILEKRLK